MNPLPSILRQTQSNFSKRRQGPFYAIKLDNKPRKMSTISTDRASANMKTRLSVNRYSLQKNDSQMRRTFNYSTISYDYLNDSQFYGTKGKMDQIQSYQTLIQERKKQIDFIGLKVSSFRGTKQQYIAELKEVEKKLGNELKSFEDEFKVSLVSLKKFLSELRRETQLEIKSFKNDLKQQNDDLIVYCDQFKRIEKKLKEFRENLQTV